MSDRAVERERDGAGTALTPPTPPLPILEEGGLSAGASEEQEARQSRQARWRGADWRLIPGTPRAPLMNMALDEVLTLRVGRGERPPTIRVWGWDRPCVVLGRFQSVKNEVNEEKMRANGVELVRRVSGGGAMFIEPEGAITWSIYAPEALVAGMTFQESYEFFDGWVVDALQELGVDAWYQPLNDITSSGGKIGGAAQARRGGAVLHHTTMAYEMNVPLMLQVLRIGQEKLSDKGVTSAEKRVGPLRGQTDLPRDVIIEHMIGHFGTQVRLTPDEVTADEIEEAEALVRERFGTKEWLYFLP